MKRVIKASGFDRYGGTHGNENMSDEAILWEEMHDAWQEACEEAYHSAVDSDDLYDMDYGKLVDFVATKARVDSQIAAYFVDKFMSWETEPLPLKASTRIKRRIVVKASTQAPYEGCRVEIDENNDIILICYDHEYNEEFEKYIGSSDMAEKNLRMLKKDPMFDVSTGLLRQIESLLDRPTTIDTSTDIRAAFGRKKSRNNPYVEAISGNVDNIMKSLKSMVSRDNSDEVRQQVSDFLQASIADLESFLAENPA